MSRRKLLYIGGWGRSGSSILANVLGSHSQIASLGEVRYIWDRGVHANKLCGCGQNFSVCPFWRRSFEMAGLGMDASFAAEQTRSVGSKAVKAQLFALLTNSVPAYAARNSLAVSALQRLYVSAADVAGKQVVVDASKVPPYAINLHGIEAFDLYFIHLVRDPRAVAFSWSKKMETLEANNESMPRYASLKSIVYWSGLNALSTWFRDRRGWSYLLVRYEDFCRNPRATVDGILQHCDIVTGKIQWYSNRALQVVAQHSISGNPSRFSVGRVEIALDDEWIKEMPAGQRRLVSALSSPVASRVGY